MGQTARMAPGRDVEAFDQRAGEYESGWSGRLHRQIADEVAGLALEVAPHPRRVLDVGCGTGYLLRKLAAMLPSAQILRGVDAAPRMIETAQATTIDERLTFVVGIAENLPYDDASFDLVVSTTSFDHWHDQRRGLAECARVLEPEGHLVLADLLSPWLLPTLFGSRRGKARTRKRLAPLLTSVGAISPNWHRLSTPLITAVTAMKP
jgi:ubiquinone/menaquinone biosynthesis C-methylase UbiE